MGLLPEPMPLNHGETVYRGDDLYKLFADYDALATLTPPDISAYDDLGPFSVQWTIPLIAAGDTVSALVNGIDKASDISFFGTVKSDIPPGTETLVQYASLTYEVDGVTAEVVEADTLTYYFPPSVFVEISSDKLATFVKTPVGAVMNADKGPVYKHGDVITYTVSVLPAEVDMDDAVELLYPPPFLQAQRLKAV